METTEKQILENALQAQSSMVTNWKSRAIKAEAENAKLRQTIDDVYERILYSETVKHEFKTENEAWLDAVALLQEARGESAP